MHCHRCHLHNQGFRILDQNFVDVAKDYCFLNHPSRGTMEFFLEMSKLGSKWLFVVFRFVVFILLN